MAAAKKAAGEPAGAAAAVKIDELIAGLGDWRGQLLFAIREHVHAAVHDVEETWKWMGSPVWEKDGILLVGNAHKQKVKLTFPHGAELSDPDGVLNNGLSGKSWRAIDLYEGAQLDVTAFEKLVAQAAALNARARRPGKNLPSST